MHSPLAQFEIKKILNINLAGIDISLTNSALFMMIAAFCILAYLSFALAKKQIVPSRLQLSAELIYVFISDMIGQNIGEKGKKFIPIIFSLFMFILICNLLGMIPYGFTVTSHISITFVLAMIVFFLVTIIGFVNHGFHFLSLFLPRGTPLWLAPLMIIIELFTYLARPITLSLRLTANMIAGHVLLKIVIGFIISLMIFLKVLPIAFAVVIIGFEIFVSMLQAYIFSILACVYLSDAVNLH